MASGAPSALPGEGPLCPCLVQALGCSLEPPGAGSASVGQGAPKPHPRVRTAQLLLLLSVGCVAQSPAQKDPLAFPGFEFPLAVTGGGYSNGLGAFPAFPGDCSVSVKPGQASAQLPMKLNTVFAAVFYEF